MAEAAGWSPAEVRSFEEGLDAHKRDFDRIASKLLPEKGPLRVGSFYYNAWKTRALPEARDWYCRRQEVGTPSLDGAVSRGPQSEVSPPSGSTAFEPENDK